MLRPGSYTKWQAAGCGNSVVDEAVGACVQTRYFVLSAHRNPDLAIRCQCQSVQATRRIARVGSIVIGEGRRAQIEPEQEARGERGGPDSAVGVAGYLHLWIARRARIEEMYAARLCIKVPNARR